MCVGRLKAEGNFEARLKEEMQDVERIIQAIKYRAVTMSQRPNFLSGEGESSSAEQLKGRGRRKTECPSTEIGKKRIFSSVSEGG